MLYYTYWSTLHSTALTSKEHTTALHCRALQHTALNSLALRNWALNCTGLYFVSTTRDDTDSSAVFYTQRHKIVHYNLLYCTSSYFILPQISLMIILKAFITSLGSEFPHFTIINIALSICIQWGNCYFILLPAVKVKGVAGYIAFDGNQVPFTFVGFWKYFSVVYIVQYNKTCPFQGRYPSDFSSSSCNFIALV